MHKKIIISISVAIAIIAIILLTTREVTHTSSEANLFEVKQGTLRINVIESGTIQASEQTIIKSEVEGQVAIIYLIDEGTQVKQGDLLVELDSSSLLDKKIDQEIMVQNAEASYISSNENLAVVENQAASDTERAKLDLEFAKQDLQKYLEGEYPNQLKETEAKITLAEEELSRAQEKLKWSNKLYEEKYISQTEYQADVLNEKSKSLDLELAKNKLDLLKNYTYTRQIAQLESDVKQNGMALERTIRKAKADIAQANANLKAKEAEFNRQKSRLEKLNDQIIKTKIYAPKDGLVIYATSAKTTRWGNTEPLEEGKEVREREELIYLPTGNQAVANVKIHESNLDKVNINQPALITVDAIPDMIFQGSIKSIAPLPDGQSRWLNPDLKVYSTDILINNNGTSLKTGMSCKAEIIIEEYENAIYVPVQAVIKEGSQPTVYVRENDKDIPRPVEAGLDNGRMIHIKSGLEKGEKILLTPPLQKAIKVNTPFKKAPKADGDVMQEKSDKRPDAPKRPKKEE